MTRMVNLFISALASIFLIGCGGGGGGNSQGRYSQISFADVEAAFPSFEGITEANLSFVDKSKLQSIANFDETVFTGNGYELDVWGDWYKRNDTGSNITYYTSSDEFDGLFEIGMSSYSNFSGLTDDVFNAEFSAVNGGVIGAYIYKEFNKNISRLNDNYRAKLESSGFECYGEELGCSKLSPDRKFRYTWYWWSDGSAHEYAVEVE